MAFSNLFASEPDLRLNVLSEQMVSFYRTTSSYTVFQEAVVTDYCGFWQYLHEDIEERLLSQPSYRALEFGAGRSGFARSLGQRRDQVFYCAQDVTDQNQDFLNKEADNVHIGPLATIDEEGQFDAVFSTFVFEHVTNPRATLDKCLALLRPGGSLYIYCPRYDFPFRISPSAAHYSQFQRIAMALDLAIARLGTLLTRRPEFRVHLDPAIFHLDWCRDRDAIHWASYYDVMAYARGKGKLRKLRIPRAPHWRAWVSERLLTMAFSLKKPG